MNKSSSLLCMMALGCLGQADSLVLQDDADIEHDWELDEEGSCPDSWVMTYALNGRIDITDTPFDMGNTDVVIGGAEVDKIELRFADDGGAPAPGQVLVTSFGILQDFTVTVDILGDFTIITDLLSTTADECGLASGQLYGTDITWDDCGFGPEHGTPHWTPDEGAYGPGCIGDYHVEGFVECVDGSMVASCTDAWFNEGVNDMDYVYNQPLLSFDFDSSDLESFTMTGSSYGIEMPTFTNNRTWLSLEGELLSMNLEPTPECLCGE